MSFRSLRQFILLLSQSEDCFLPCASEFSKNAGVYSALLNLARLTHGEVNRSNVHLTSIVKTVAAELIKSHPERRVTFVIADDVTVDGDPVLLRNVIQNLLDNAFKFTGNRAISRIEFGVKLDNGNPIYFVKDDGAGFNMENVNKLFTPFQRLHTSSEFPGLGIGLATTQRIIHQHGGRIWAEGEVNKGATFSLPAKIDNKSNEYSCSIPLIFAKKPVLDIYPVRANIMSRNCVFCDAYILHSCFG